MHHPWKTAAMCEGKDVFDSRGQAERVAKRMRKRRGTNSIQTYRCNICGAWHIGCASHVRDKKPLGALK